MPRPNNIHVRRTLAHGKPSVLARPAAPPEPEPEHIRKLRVELERKTRILESSLLSLDNLISPLDWLDSGDGFPGFGSWRFVRPVNRTQDRTHAPINYLNEEEWRWSVAYGRDLCMRNHLAIGFRDHVSNFIGPIAISFVLRGQSPGATSSGPDDADSLDTPAVDPLVRECTTAWEEWCEHAEWGQGELDREEECRKRWIVEGECTLRFFVGDSDSDGLPYVRHIEPELIRTPPGHSTIDHWGWGIRTEDDDDEKELGLWVCHPENVSEGKVVEAGEYVRIKSNVDRTIRRGLSDFFPVAEQLRKVMGLLDNMAHVARLQAAIAWWEQYPTASLSQVQAMIDASADYTRTKLPPNTAGSNVDVANYEPGTVVRTEQRTVNPGPVSTGSTQFAQVEQMVLRGVGFRWGCPSYFSGDGQDSFASVLVTGSPFVRITESRQEKFKGFCRKVASRVLEYCEGSGRLPRGTCKRVRPVATARPVVIADEEKQARTFLSLYEKNCADPVEFIRKRGGDPKVVAANIAAWQKKFAPPQEQQGPGGGMGGGMQPGGGPVATPPGSAGGDGSSPNVEGRRFGESTGGNPAHPEGELYTGSDGEKYVNVKGTDGKLHATKLTAQQNQPINPTAGAPGGTNSNATHAANSQGGEQGNEPMKPTHDLDAARQLDEDERHKAVLAVLNRLPNPTNDSLYKKSKELWMQTHLSTLHDDDLRLIIHHYAESKKYRAEVKPWATTANEVFLNRLTGGELQHGQNQGWDGQSDDLLMNYKLVTDAGRQDNFGADDVLKVVFARIANKKTDVPFARVTILAVPNDPGGHNGLYIYPGTRQGKYRKDGTGDDEPIRVLSAQELDDLMKQPNGRQKVQEAIKKTMDEKLDRAKMQAEMRKATQRELAKGIQDLDEVMTEEGKASKEDRDETAVEAMKHLSEENLGACIRGVSDDKLAKSLATDAEAKAKITRILRREPSGGYPQSDEHV